MRLRLLTHIAFMLLVANLTVTAGTGHIGNAFLPEGCGSCHVGHGLSGEPMMAASEEDQCYTCHGSANRRADAVARGLLAQGANLDDIEREFSRTYRHPVEEGMGHSPGERLPSFSGSRASHAECVDCHNPHDRVGKHQRGVSGVAGYSLSGQYLDKVTYEYEICLKCHTDLIAGPDSRSNIPSQFASSVRSMHPVTRPSDGGRQPSLQASGEATMLCSDCHRSNDPSAPAGPHGSDFEFLLSGNYDRSGNASESPLAFEFCYSCHDRSSILSNESFPLHREHIEGDALRNIPGTSCYTCHASHSSERNPFLLSFNRAVVSGSQPGNRILYQSRGSNSGLCYLSCHGHNHGPAEY